MIFDIETVLTNIKLKLSIANNEQDALLEVL